MLRRLAPLALFACASLASPPAGADKTRVANPFELAATRLALDRAAGRYDLVPEPLRRESLTVDGKTYARARIRSFDAFDAVVFYDHGIAMLPVEKLPADLRARLGHNDASPPVRPPPPPPPPAPARPKPRAPAVLWSHDPVQRALLAFGERPAVRREVDLRPEMESFGLAPKDQGRSPSCAVFAITAALEYHLAKFGRKPERHAEPFLLWASLRSIGRTKDRVDIFGGELSYEGGLGLVEVAQALRCYGIPPAAELPAKFDPQRDTPAESVQRRAWENSRTGYILLNGRSTREQLEQLILVLNEGIPVVIGITWPVPSPEFARTGDIADRPANAGYGHAIVVTGYACPDGIVEHTVFRFRNSHGAAWGDKGFGTVPWAYLEKNYTGGLFLDLR